MPQFVHLSRSTGESGSKNPGASVEGGCVSKISGRSVTVQVRVGEERGNALEVVDLVEELQKRGGRGCACADQGQSIGVRGLPVCGCNHPAGPSSYPGRSCRDPCTVSLAFEKKR